MKKELYPDRNVTYMQEEFGTCCLITDVKSDKYMQIHAKAERKKKARVIEDAWTI